MLGSYPFEATGRDEVEAKVLIAAMAFATLEAEGYGQFVGSIQRPFPQNMMNRSGMEVRAVPLFLHFWHDNIHHLRRKCFLSLKKMELDSDGDKSAGPSAL